MAQYNDYARLPFIPYKIVEYLAMNNENIWKLLKYDSYDCLSKPDLTLSEKMELVWTEGRQEKKRLFLTNLIEDMIGDSTTVIKINKLNTAPKDHLQSVTSYEFSILYGGKISMVSYEGIPCNRGDIFEYELLSTLNGVNVGGVGTMQFNNKLSSFSRSANNIGNNKTYTGVNIIMGVLTTNIKAQKGNEC